ncbi:MAG: aminotransferase class V-fold PLP-dependent enzyme [Pseudomonadota bacterium]
MTLAHGREYLAIPGPSVMPDRVLRAMHRAAPNIYTGELFDMMPGIARDLKTVAGGAQHVAMYIGNGHAAWEAALANVVSRGDRVLSLASGTFGKGWGACAEALGASVEVLDFGRQQGADADALAQRLAADKDHQIKAVLVTHVDTSSSALTDVPGVRAAMDAAGHPALLMVDCIASLACDRFEMAAWGVDVMVAASQKGLMTPPGMCFVFYNDRADALRETADCVTSYWDWRPRTDADQLYLYFFGTAPTHHLYGLRAALDMIAEEGLQPLYARHEKLAEMVWAAADVWSATGDLAFNIADKTARSRAVTTLLLPTIDAAALRAWTETKAGVTLGLGIGFGDGDDSVGHFRIGHMGHVNGQMVFGALGAIDAALKALDIAHGPGALEAAAKVLAAN